MAQQADKKCPFAALYSSFVNDVRIDYAFLLRILTGLHLDIFDRSERVF